MLRALALVLALGGTAVAQTPFDPSHLGEASQVDDVGKPGVLAGQWVEQAYGVDTSQVPVYILPLETFEQVYQTLGGRSHAMGVSVEGFAFDGVVYVKKGGLFGISAKTLTHELLHALSPRFTREAHAHGKSNLIEGVTEFFTLRATPPEKLPRGVRVRKSVYGAYTQFAGQLAAIVGAEVLADCYFEKGYVALERAVDRRVGKGRLRRATKFLQVDDLDGALQALETRY